MALMKNSNRRTFIQLFAAAAATVVLLPRKALGQALGIKPDAAKADAAAENDFRAAAALIRKAPQSVSHAARPARRSVNT